MLSSLDASLCPTEFVYGRNGRPCLVQGPNDSEERVDRILARLEAKLGPEGYDFEIEEDDDLLGDEAIAELRESLLDFFHSEPDEVPRFYKVIGIVTASLLQPVPVSPSEIMEEIWPHGREWKNQTEVADFLSRFGEYMNYLNQRILEAISPDEHIENAAKATPSRTLAKSITTLARALRQPPDERTHTPSETEEDLF